MRIFIHRRIWALQLMAIVLSSSYMVVALADGGETTDVRLYGTWQTTSYNVQGEDYEMDGLMIITPKYFVGNTIYSIEGQSAPNANANSGPYVIKDGKIFITQWMQLHWRPDDEKENYLTQGVVEEIPYRFEDGNLVFFFPSGNKYVSHRLE